MDKLSWVTVSLCEPNGTSCALHYTGILSICNFKSSKALYLQLNTYGFIFQDLSNNFPQINHYTRNDRTKAIQFFTHRASLPCIHGKMKMKGAYPWHAIRVPMSHAFSSGTNLRQLQTVAEYDVTSQEFVINSQKPEGRKWWPGGREYIHLLVGQDTALFWISGAFLGITD